MTGPEEHDETGHALLSPSAAHRWTTCTASVRMEQLHPDSDTSEYAEEGSYAHLWASEYELPKRLGLIDALTARRRKATLTGSEAGRRWHSPELERHVSTYVDEVVAAMTVIDDDGTAPADAGQARTRAMGRTLVQIEQRVRLDEIAPECWGTADALLLSHDGTCIAVLDLKYGQGVRVDAPGNPQLMCYGLGALLAWRCVYDVQTVSMRIVQPRLGHVSVYETSAADLMTWGRDVLAPAAREALGPQEGQRFAPSESACRWCSAAGSCAARADYVLDQDFGTVPDTMTMEQLAEALGRIPQIESWCKAVRGHALGTAKAGGVVPGYKLVEGRSVRKIVDPDTAAYRLGAAGLSRNQYLRDPELRTLTELSRLVPDLDAVLGDALVKPPGAPTLVPVDDKRPEIGSAAAAERDFS